MNSLAGKSIIITGGGSGIGAVTAVMAAARGASVTIADISDAAHSVLQDIQSDGGQAQFIKTDISDEAQVRALVASSISRYGPLSGAFNNAGVPGYSHSKEGGHNVFLADLPTEKYRRNIEVNLIGTFLCMKYEIAEMLKTGGGAIVNTSSSAGLVAIRGAPDYVSAKHGIIGLTKSAALDYAEQGIRVNALLPGGIRTPMNEVAFANADLVAATSERQVRIGEPNEIAEAALWLLSDAASLVNGIAMPVDAGFLAS